MRIGRRMCVLGAAGVLVASVACGQYETPQEYSPLEARYFSAGVMVRDFAPRAGYTGGDSLAISYNAWMPVIGYHQGSVDVLFGYTRYTLKGATRASLFFSTQLSNDMPLLRGRPVSLALPLLLSVDYTKAESQGTDRDHFNIASLGLGLGLKFRSVTPGTEISASMAGIYHYSFEGFSTGNGSSAAVVGDASVLLRTVHIVDGIVFGYRFRHQIWTFGDGRWNYRVTTHGPYFGVML
jgi:hypothetical protein